MRHHMVGISNGRKSSYRTVKVFLNISLGVLLLFSSKDSYCNVSLFPGMLVSIIWLINEDMYICLITFPCVCSLGLAYFTKFSGLWLGPGFFQTAECYFFMAE